MLDTDKILVAAEKLGDKMVLVAEQYGPEVSEVVLAAARVDAAQGLVGAAVALLISLAGAIYATILWPQELSRGNGDPTGKGVVWIICIIGSIALFVCTIPYVANVWRWAGVIEPKLWLAGKVLGLM